MRRLYHILALTALIGMFATGGLLGYMVATGKLTAERVDLIAAVLRGESPRPEVPTSQPVQAPPPPMRSREELTRLQARREFYELLADRHKREVEDRIAVNQQVQHETVRLLEQLEKHRQEFGKEKEEFNKQSNQQGFDMALEMLSSADPKVAKDILRKGGQFKEADVVRLLMAMDDNRRKKIVNACKGDDELQWIGRILTQIHNLNNGAASDVDGSARTSKTGG